MKQIDLTTTIQSADDLLVLAETDAVLIKTASGKVFLLTEVVEPDDEDDDFAAEVERTRQNVELMALLEERSKEPGRYSLEQVRERLGLSKP